MDSLKFNIKVPLLEKAASNMKDIISHIKLNDGIYFDKNKYDENDIIMNLECTNIYKKIETMKHILIAHILKIDVSNLFFDVLKNISINNLTLKKLIYNYLILYAEGNEELTILTINSFKNDLNNNNYQIRASALKAMASIKSIDMINILMNSLKKLSKDKSPYVRKSCADVIPSIYNIDKDQFMFLRKILLDLINDQDVVVLSSAIMSFNSLCIYNNTHRNNNYDNNNNINNCDFTLQDFNNFKPNIYKYVNSNDFNYLDKNNSDSYDFLYFSSYEHFCKINCIENERCKMIEQKDGMLEVKEPERQKEETDDNNIGLSDIHINENNIDKKKNEDAPNIFMKHNFLEHPKECSNYKENNEMYNSLLCLHPYYYKLCSYLLIIHPYHQTYLIDLLLRYCKMFYKDPLSNKKINLKKKTKKENKLICFNRSFINNESCYLYNIDEDDFSSYEVDIEIFIDKLLLLLSSNSCSVVLMCISSLYHLTKFFYKEYIIDSIINTLFRCTMEKNEDMYEIFLKSVKHIIIYLKDDFVKYISFFYIKPQDTNIIKSIKIDLLYILKNDYNKIIILDEFLYILYIPGNTEDIIKKLFSYITSIALTNSLCLSKAMQHIIIMLNSNIKLYSYQSILSLRKLLKQSHKNQIVKILFFLCKILLSIHLEEVKISILWTLTKYQKYIDPLLLYDISRILLKSFHTSTKVIKIHIIHFVFKIWIYQYASIMLLSNENINNQTNDAIHSNNNNNNNNNNINNNNNNINNNNNNINNNNNNINNNNNNNVNISLNKKTDFNQGKDQIKIYTETSQDTYCEGNKIYQVKKYPLQDDNIIKDEHIIDQIDNEHENNKMNPNNKKNNNNNDNNDSNNNYDYINEHTLTNSFYTNDEFHKNNISILKKHFENYEKLCKQTFMIALKDHNFNVQDTSKTYMNIFLRLKELSAQKNISLNILQRNFFNEHVDIYSIPLYFLKDFFRNDDNIVSSKAFPENENNCSMKVDAHEKKTSDDRIKVEDNTIKTSYDKTNTCNDKINEKYNSNTSPCEENTSNDFNYTQNPFLFQLNTVSNILNKKISSYVELPDFAHDDLPKIEHINKNEKKENITSISSKDIPRNNPYNKLINERVFTNIDDFYKEQNFHTSHQTNKNSSGKSILFNKGTKIQGEDEESEDENEHTNGHQNKHQNKHQTFCNNSNNQSTTINNTSHFKHEQIIDEQIIDEQMDDIEKFFFSDTD
ncbi:hypothetical protein PFFVO_01383 [Plasmodium falciparum Vietnam Oak-Knoll (FVO)]|uniref:Clathrin/coatomer adaptor adaptin-like N-terminal domain-containing protein n=1 Tax=Plasmodium falciparum Vietnam Oak-Knoll (FVO) TaxID=1036723 RepID=A0A024VB32_PLAFA|nr:hypothetical protein PFFVO_01383 [Plasmodium falciparum Vietnam Oak-Knoll (FVO)]